MTGAEGRCPACFQPGGDQNRCDCGYEPGEALSPLLLPPGTAIRSDTSDQEYQVGLVLGTGGFGVTYLGWDSRSERRLAIKEYLPRDQVGRSANATTVRPHTTEAAVVFRHGLVRFQQEAEVLRAFRHPNVVSELDSFAANGTAYLVMPYYEGCTLSQYLDERRRLEPSAAVAVTLSVLDGLRHVHDTNVEGKRWMHRDVKPDNVFLRSDSSPILIDFGAARAEVGGRSRDMSVVLTSGYAPYEQYFSSGRAQGPWVDVYGCAATLYHALTGEAPANAPDRHDAVSHGERDPLVPPAELVTGIPSRLNGAVLKGLAVDYRSRPQDARQFREHLKGVATTEYGASETARQGGAACPACGAQPRKGARFCKRCGRALFREAAPASLPDNVCSFCQARMHHSARYCNRCGQRL